MIGQGGQRGWFEGGIGAAFGALCLALGGCGGSETPAGTTDAGGSDASADVGADSAVEGGADTADAGCDLSPVLTVAPFTASSYVLVKDDAGVTVPSPTGGDTKGDFRVAKLTVYLAAAAEGQVDPAKSSASGVGWFSFGDTTFRSSTDTKVTFETSIVGTVKRNIATSGKGTYTVSGGKITLSPVCGSTTAEAPVRELGWSRLDADHAYVFLPPPTGAGAALTLATVLELERIK